MVFNSAVFLVFFIVTFLLYFCAGKTKNQRLVLLTVCNLVFYASWSPEATPLILGIGLIDFYIAKALGDDRNTHRSRFRKALLIFSVLSNLGVLVLYKYADALLGGIAGTLTLLGRPTQPAALNWIAPLGISFFTFQSLSYTIDSYRRTYKPHETVLEFLASLTFFPHLLAGPIVRSSFLVPQFSQLAFPKETDVRNGVLLIAGGLIKKTLADIIAPVVAAAYSAKAEPDFVQSWAGVLGFAGQIYGDFSGYTDMATGIALLLGFKLPVNFQLPYLSTSPMEFWRRWHISLSLWFRDYVYYPLALGRFRRLPYLNLFLVMFLAGVWHGASLTCALFGVYHGLLLASAQWVSSTFGGRFNLPRSLKIGVTFYFILIGQMFFRATNVASFWKVFRGIHGFAFNPLPSDAWNSLAAAAIILVFCHLLDYLIQERRDLVEKPAFYWGVATASSMLAIVAGINSAFIYFQF
jgi:alginate O-acetyltransferase complex protein AlgI